MSPAAAFAAGLARGQTKMQMQENLRGHAAALRFSDPEFHTKAARIKSFLDYLDSVPDEARAA